MAEDSRPSDSSHASDAARLSDSKTSVRSPATPPSTSSSGGTDNAPTVISKRRSSDEFPLFARKLRPQEMGEILLNQQLGHFVLEEFVGGGGMGAVFRAHDNELGRVVAVKVISRDQTEVDAVRRFKNEAQSAARLDHKNIARVYYVGEHEGWSYIVFEYIEGVNIRDLVDHRGPLPLDQAIAYTLQVAEALAHASERDVVHRDIKPSNVLVMGDGTVKLVDMGLARLHQVDSQADDLTASGMTLGTFDYISPEQARDPRLADVRSDLYSLGCTLYFMLTGVPPFPEGTVLQKLLSHSTDQPPDPRDFRPDLPEEMVEILHRLLAKQPIQRHQHPGELIAELIVLAETLGISTAGTLESQWVAPAQPTHPWMAIIPVACPVLLLIAAVMALGWFSPPAVEMAAPTLGEPLPLRTTTSANSRNISSDPIPSSESSGNPESGELPSPTATPASDSTSKASDDPAGPVTVDPAEDLSSTAGSSNSSDSSDTEDNSAASPGVNTSGGEAADATLEFTSSDRTQTVDSLPLGSTGAALFASGSQGAVTASRNAVEGELAAGSANAPSIDGEDVPAENPVIPVRRIIVVPAELPASSDADVAPPTAPGTSEVSPEATGSGLLQVSSLDQAIRQAAEDDSVEIIEIRASGIVPVKPIRWNEPRPLQIIASLGSAPQLLFQPSPASLLEQRRMIQIAHGQLAFRGIHFSLELPALPSDGWALFQLQDVQQFSCESCTFTIAQPALEASMGSSAASVFHLESNLTAEAMVIGEDEPVGPGTPLIISLQNCAARGEADLVVSEGAGPFSLVWKQGLSILTGHLVVNRGMTSSALTWDNKVRIDLSHVTAVVNRGLYQADMRQNASGLLELDLKLNQCIVVTDSTAPLITHLGVQEVEQVRKSLRLRGSDNFYPRSQTRWRITPAGRSGDEAVVEFSFEQKEEPWYEEVGASRFVMWESSPPSERPYHAHTAKNYRLDPSLSNPAAAAGFTPGEIPTWPWSQAELP